MQPSCFTDGRICLRKRIAGASDRSLACVAVITFADQVVLVTGAGRGLGASYARMLAARGATVIVHDAGVERDGSGEDPGVAAAVAESIVAGGDRAEAETQNLADRTACRDLVSSVRERHGRIDALVHSAGIVRYHGIAETTSRDWQRMLDVNVSAAWWLCQAVWPGMVARRYGRIVLTTSGFALRAIPRADVTGYSVGKAAQFGLMNALAAEGEPHGILVNALAPVAATRIFRREVGADEMSPDAVAPAAAALASRECPWTGRVLVAQDGEFAFDSMVRTPVRDLGRTAQPEDILRLSDDIAGTTLA
jgi:NAD(P)-dependent dehydrogenase (short-subunit alcohol dehydrogenase family)